MQIRYIQGDPSPSEIRTLSNTLNELLIGSSANLFKQHFIKVRIQST